MKQVIIKQLQNLLDSGESRGLKRKVNGFKREFRNVVEERKQQHRQKFITEGGDLADYKGFKDPLDREFYGLVDNANEKIQLEELEEKKRQKLNVENKKAIITELQTMVDEVAPSDIGKGFEILKQIEAKWKSSGRVFGEQGDDLFFKFKHQKDRFFQIVSINNEMRDIDFQKNMRIKQAIITKMEALKASGGADNPQIIKELQKLNLEWRNSGPIPKEFRDSVYGKHRELNEHFGVKIESLFEERRKNAKENLTSKVALCDKVKAINLLELNTPKAWNEQTQEILNIQQEWKKIGFSEENETVWEAFRQCVDQFFEGKRNFFDTLDSKREENAVAKQKLVEDAEKMMHSEDWRNTTNFYINLQKKWKATGPAPREQENEMWDKFRAACDTFFNAKKEYYSNIDEIHEENLTKKEALITQIEALQLTGSAQEDFISIRKFFSDWNAIGHVPMDKKDDLYKRYRAACDAKFDQLNANKDEQRKMRVEAELEDIMNSENAEYLLQRKKDGLRDSVDRLSNEIAQIENNMGFFKGNLNMLGEYEKQLKRKKAQRIELEKELNSLPTSPTAEANEDATEAAEENVDA